VSAIGYYLEREGIMTTSISLVRENTASMQPPRALWVPFPLGRPLGVPNNPAFQQRVITAALDLLDRPEGPVLENYSEEAPPIEVESALACPVSFAKPSETESWSGRLASEVTTLKPWHALSLRRRAGRTLTGLSEHSIEDNLKKLGEMLDSGDIPSQEFRWLKFAIEDAKAFYIEALTAQPGDYVQTELQRILWQDTQLGYALRTCHQLLVSDPSTRPFAGIIAPREAIATAAHSTPSGDIN
jgi:D-proline reductase (dithiol) PrdB